MHAQRFILCCGQGSIPLHSRDPLVKSSFKFSRRSDQLLKGVHRSRKRQNVALCVVGKTDVIPVAEGRAFMYGCGRWWSPRSRGIASPCPLLAMRARSAHNHNIVLARPRAGSTNAPPCNFYTVSSKFRTLQIGNRLISCVSDDGLMFRRSLPNRLSPQARDGTSIHVKCDACTDEYM